MLQAIDRYGRELTEGDIVMKGGEFLMFSHATEKELYRLATGLEKVSD